MSRAESIAWCTVAYGCALAVAVAIVWRWGSAIPPLGVVAVADVAATLVVFAFSVGFDNSSFYDPYWSVAPPAIVAFWAFTPDGGAANPIRTGVVAGLVLVWAVRLTYNWLRGWRGVRHEDWRYAQMRPGAGRFYWALSLFGFHLFPTGLVFAGCLPLAVALTSSAPFGPWGIVGSTVMLAAIAIEAIADQQLHRFRIDRASDTETLERGLWRYSRHPNYFGEWAFWMGLFVVGLDAGPGAWWTVVGPLLMLGLFALVSIPLIETRMLRRRPGYAERVRRVSSFVPWPPS